jgi:hypothetical protein
MRLNVSVRAGLWVLGVTAATALLSGGCSGESDTGAVTKPAPEQGSRYRAMEDHMKTESSNRQKPPPVKTK